MKKNVDVERKKREREESGEEKAAGIDPAAAAPRQTALHSSRSDHSAVWSAVCIKIIADMEKILSTSTSAGCTPVVSKLLRNPCGYG